MSEYTLYVDGPARDHKSCGLGCSGGHSYSQFNDLEITVTYTAYPGSPDTRWEPGEPPSVEIESFRICDDLAELLGCNPEVDVDKLAQLVDLESLADDILDAHREQWEDEPEPDDDF